MKKTHPVGSTYQSYCRTTILPQEDVTKEMLERLREFHLKFLKQYA